MPRVRDASPRALYYALGGGLGHGIRELALARQLARRVGGRHVLAVNTPLSGALRAAAERDAAVEIREFAPTDTADEAGRRLLALRDELAPSLLVVDTFPRGLGGELAAWIPAWSSGLKTLVSRTLPAAYVREFQLARFVAEAYDVVLAPGEPSPLATAENAPRVVTTAAWLVRSPDEIEAPDAAAARLGMAPHERCVLVVGTGSVAECVEWGRWFVDLLRDWPRGAPPLRLALPRDAQAPVDAPRAVLVRHAPLMELYRGAELVVGNAGYHLVHETRALGVPALFVARDRRYDDQASRLTSTERASDLRDLKSRLLTAYAAPRAPRPPTELTAVNGAEQAAEILARSWREFMDS